MEDFVWHDDVMWCNYLETNVEITRTLFTRGRESESHYEDVPGLIGCKRTLECAKVEVPCVRALIDHPERYKSYEEISPGVFRDFLFEEVRNTSEGQEPSQEPEEGDKIHPKFT